jgi:hypothetical protein
MIVGYALFMWIGYCESGGMGDYRGGFDSIEAAHAAVDLNQDYAHIAAIVRDADTGSYGLTVVQHYTKRAGWFAAQDANPADLTSVVS